MKQKHSEMYMNMASVASKSSTAEKLKVGAIVVKDHRILSVGYNGTPPGTDNVCEDKVWVGDEQVGDYQLVTRKEVIHAEMNAIYKMARDGQAGAGADIFITHAPCHECAKAIISVGFKKVWYRNSYRNDDGVHLLLYNNIAVEKVNG